MNIDDIITVAKKAGKYLVEMQGSNPEVELKEGNSPVTEIDRTSERMIIEELNKDGYNVVSEEIGIINNNSEYTWFIDPLDGTKEYLAGGNAYAVSIALAKNEIIEMGVVYLPKKDILYTAEKGKGAFRNGEKISVSKNSDFNTSRMVLSPDTIRKDIELVESLGVSYEPGRSFANKVCMIASGEMDATFYFPQNKWDFAAGQIILEEAGGKLTDKNGEDVIYDLSKPQINGALATNAILHTEYLERIKSFLSQE